MIRLSRSRLLSVSWRVRDGVGKRSVRLSSRDLSSRDRSFVDPLVSASWTPPGKAPLSREEGGRQASSHQFEKTRCCVPSDGRPPPAVVSAPAPEQREMYVLESREDAHIRAIRGSSVTPTSCTHDRPGREATGAGTGTSCKPSSVRALPKPDTRRSCLWGRRCRRPPARHPLRPRITGATANRRSELLALARGGVCRAPSVTGTGGALLPHRFTLACDRGRIGGLFSVALSLTRSPRAGGCCPPPSSCRARTFLAETLRPRRDRPLADGTLARGCSWPPLSTRYHPRPWETPRPPFRSRAGSATT